MKQRVAQPASSEVFVHLPQGNMVVVFVADDVDDNGGIGGVGGSCGGCGGASG